MFLLWEKKLSSLFPEIKTFFLGSFFFYFPFSFFVIVIVLKLTAMSSVDRLFSHQI